METTLNHKRNEDRPYCPICLALNESHLLGIKTVYQPKLIPDLFRLKCPNCGSNWYCPRELYLYAVKNPC